MRHEASTTMTVPDTRSTSDDFIGQADECVRRMLAVGTPRREILTRLATAAEAASGPGVVVFDPGNRPGRPVV